MDLKGVWQGRHIVGGKTTYPFKAKFEEMPSGYVLSLQADESLPSSTTPYKATYVNRLEGIIHNKDDFKAKIDKTTKPGGTFLPFDQILEDHVEVYREDKVPTFWLHLVHKNEYKLVVFKKNSPKPANDVPVVTKSANPMNVGGVFWGRWYKSAAHYDEGLPIFNWAAALLQDETQTYYLDLLAMTGGTGAGSMPKPTTEGYRFRLKYVTHGENTLKAPFSTDPPPKKQQQPYDRVHTVDPLVVTRDNSPNKRPEFILYIEGHKIIFTMNHPPSSSELRGAYEAPKASGPPTSGPSTLRKPGANAPRNVKRVGAPGGAYTADARVPAVDRTAHSSYLRDERIPGTYKNVVVKSKTRECVAKKDAVDKHGRPMYTKNNKPVQRCAEWKQLAPRTHHVQGATVHEAPATKRRRTVSATSRPKREVHMVNDPYGTCEKRYVGACVPQARLDAYYAK